MTTPHTLSRRKFLTLMAGTSLVGAAATMTGCSPVSDPSGTGWLPNQYRNAAILPPQLKGRVPIDPQDPSIMRDDSKCILCGQCLEACEKVQSVYGFYELPTADEFICVHCGQCALWCPTGSIRERDQVDEVLAALENPDLTVIAQPSPATRVGIGEEFGLPAGAWAEGQLATSMKEAGFDYALDINFAADLTIMEEASELVERITTGGVLPQFTSCCPAWVKFVEYYYPDLLEHVSSTRSPIGMQGPIVKTYFAEKNNLDPHKIFNVTLTPCVAKKFEIARSELKGAADYYQDDTIIDNDVILCAREYANLLRKKGLDNFAEMPQGHFDPLMGVGSGAGLIFGNTGGVMEAAVRSAYYFVTGNEPPEDLLHLEAVRGLDGIKRATVNIPGAGEVKVVVAHGLGNARKLCEEVRAGKADFHFMEVMACPGGCISGGGQPRTSVPPQDWVRQARIDSMYAKDAAYPLRNSHDNPEIIALYDQFLGKPLGHLAHQLLHTTHHSRAEHLTPKKVDENGLLLD